MPPPRLSGLQKDVLGLYRSILREAVRKDRARGDAVENLTPSTMPSVCDLLSASAAVETTTAVGSVTNGVIGGGSSASYARAEFRKEAASVRRADFKTIEYKIRKGWKHLKLLQMPGVVVVGGTR